MHRQFGYKDREERQFWIQALIIIAASIGVALCCSELYDEYNRGQAARSEVIKLQKDPAYRVRDINNTCIVTEVLPAPRRRGLKNYEVLCNINFVFRGAEPYAGNGFRVYPGVLTIDKSAARDHAWSCPKIVPVRSVIPGQVCVITYSSVGECIDNKTPTSAIETLVSKDPGPTESRPELELEIVRLRAWSFLASCSLASPTPSSR